MREPAQGQAVQREPLGPEDRAILALESAVVAGHTCKVMWIGPGAPSVAELRERIAERIHLTPALTQRLGGPVDAPVWEPDPDFDVSNHIGEHRHVQPLRRRSHLAGYLRRELARSRSRSPFDGPIGARREVGFGSAPLRALHDAAKSIDGATLNDAVLTIVAGSLRHWVDLQHGRVDSVRVKVPVSMHREGDAVANRDSSFSFGLPLSEPDPVTRLRIVHARTQARKAARDAEQREVLLHRISGVSPRLERFVVQLERSPRRFALNVSNVPGPRYPVSVLSSPVRRMYSLAEISRHHALRVSVVSFADQLCFGFCADSDLVPNVQTLAAQVEPESQALIGALR